MPTSPAVDFAPSPFASPADEGTRSHPFPPTDDGVRSPSGVHSPVGGAVRSPTGERRTSNPFGPRRSLALPRTSLAAPAREPGAINPYAPPSLEYDLRQRKRSIFIFWFLILFDSIVMPLALYFGLWYGTDLSPNTVFSIVTAALGGISIFEYVLRFWHLWKKGSTCRVIGGRRSYVRSTSSMYAQNIKILTPEPARLVPLELQFCVGHHHR